MIAGYEAMNIIRKGQIRWLSKGDVLGQKRFIERLLGSRLNYNTGPAYPQLYSTRGTTNATLPTTVASSCFSSVSQRYGACSPV
jgi:hypothetical protein